MIFKLQSVVFLLITLFVTGCGTVSTSSPNLGLKRTIEKSQNTTSTTTGDWIPVKLNQVQLGHLQTDEAQGHRVSLLIPEEVARDFVFNTPDLKMFSNGDVPNELPKDNVLVISKYAQTLRLHLVQPIKQGHGGIWAVDRYQITK